MFQKIRKNKFFRKALVFASVFLILATSLVLPCFAQALPNYLPSSSASQHRFYPLYEDSNITVGTTIPIAVLFRNNTNDISTWRIIFFEKFLDSYISNYENAYMLTGDYIYSQVLITRPVYVAGGTGYAWDDLYNLHTNSNIDTSSVFINSWNSQFAWAKSETLAKNQISSDYATLQSNYNNLQSDYDNLETEWSELYEKYLAADTEGYTRALNDMNAFEKGLFSIFNAPFVFVQNIVGFEIFGVSLTEILVFILILCIGYVILRFIGGALPL